MKQLESFFADNVFLHVDLDALASALQVRKTRLAHQAKRYDAARDTHFALSRLQFRCGRLGVLLYESSRCIRPAKFSWIWIVPQRLDLLEFLLALLKLVARLKLQRENPFRKRRSPSITA